MCPWNPNSSPHEAASISESAAAASTPRVGSSFAAGCVAARADACGFNLEGIISKRRNGYAVMRFSIGIACSTATATLCAVAADKVQPRWPWPVL